MSWKGRFLASLMTLFAVSACDDGPSTTTQNASNDDDLIVYENSNRRVEFRDNTTGLDQVVFYKKGSGGLEPILGITEQDIYPKKAKDAADLFLDTGKVSWKSNGATLTINAVPPPISPEFLPQDDYESPSDPLLDL